MLNYGYFLAQVHDRQMRQGSNRSSEALGRDAQMIEMNF